MAILLLPVNLLRLPGAVPRHRPGNGAGRARPPAARRPLRADYAGQVLMRLGVTVLPLLVIATLGPAANAYFFVPFTIVIAFDMMVLGIGTSLLAESSYDARLVRDHIATAVRRYGPLLLAGVLLLVVAAPLALLPFGEDYAREGDAPAPAGAREHPARPRVPRGRRVAAGRARPVAARDRGDHARGTPGTLAPLADGMGITGVAMGSWVRRPRRAWSPRCGW